MLIVDWLLLTLPGTAVSWVKLEPFFGVVEAVALAPEASVDQSCCLTGYLVIHWSSEHAVTAKVEGKAENEKGEGGLTELSTPLARVALSSIF